MLATQATVDAGRYADLVHTLDAGVTFVPIACPRLVPLIEDDGFVLYESQVINEYLAERFEWKTAFSADLRQRARERLAMKQFDDSVVPLFFKTLKDPSAIEATPNWEREIDSIAHTVKSSKPDSLLGIHMATHWLRFGWVAPGSKLVEKINTSGLGAFLDQAVALPQVQQTVPDREKTTRMMLEKFGPKPA